jgi:2-phosphosulfolactate phosphatase
MHIEIVDFVAGARTARGIVVVIDVFRAFSVEAYAFSRGAVSCMPVAEVELARQLKADDPTRVLVGERHGRRLSGFDCGNSPTELEAIDVAGRTLVHTTHAGTQGLVNAVDADEVITGALVNAAAIVRYIKSCSAKRVTLVRMGHEARERCDEDDLCAELIAMRLRGGNIETTDIRDCLLKAPSAQKFFDPTCDWAPERDFELCTAVDVFDFVLRLDRQQSLAIVQRVDS